MRGRERPDEEGVAYGHAFLYNTGCFSGPPFQLGYGVVANIIVSHTIARGSIPRIRIFFSSFGNVGVSSLNNAVCTNEQITMHEFRSAVAVASSLESRLKVGTSSYTAALAWYWKRRGGTCSGSNAYQRMHGMQKISGRSG